MYLFLKKFDNYFLLAYLCKKINKMNQQKELKLIKAFHVSPAVAAEFDQLRLELQKRADVKVTGSDFFARLVLEAAERAKAPQTEINH